ncbi:hypothetical protein PMAG_a4024 [Pseudoalteromonas mariniglutinosa NCIMB 1770]|nr:hypothetical protein [Pseudoalteromonas mariniglutinosa NCIMB 1770]
MAPDLCSLKQMKARIVLFKVGFNRNLTLRLEQMVTQVTKHTINM